MAEKLVTVVDPDTQKTVEVPETELKSRLGAGFVLDTPELAAQRADKAKYGEGFGNEAAAFTESALAAPTLGLSHLAEEGLGVSKEGIAKREQYNPAASGAGTLLGLGAGALIPGVGEEEAAGGALGAAGRAATTPMRAVTGAGEAVGKGTESIARRLLAGVPGDMAEHAPSILGGAADTATQAAMYNAANQIDETHLAGGNLDQGIENALATTPDALVLGAGLHAVGAIGGHVALKGAQAAVDGLGNLLRDKILPLVGDASAEGFARASSAITGEPLENLKKFTGGVFQPGSEGAEARTGLTDIRPPKTNAELAEQRDVLAKELYEKLDATLQQTKELAFKGTREGSETAGIVPAEREQLLSGASSQAAVDEAQRLGEHLRQTADQLASDPVTYAPNIAKKAMALSRDFDEKLAHTSYGALLGEKTTAPVDLYNLIEDTKSQIAKRSRFGMVASTTEQDALSLFKQSGMEFRKSLENPQVWGEQGARQAELNRAVSDHLMLLGKKGAFRKDFMMEKAGRGGSLDWVIDRTKVNTFLNKLGAARGDRQMEALNTFLDNAQELVEQTRKSAKTTGLDLSHEKYVQSLLDTAQSKGPLQALGQTQEGVAANRGVVQQGIAQQADQAKMRALANGPFVTGVDPSSMMPKLPGALSTGVPGMVTAPIRGAVKALKNPLQSLQTLAKLEKFADTTSRKIQRGIGSFLKKTGSTAERIAEKERPAIAISEAKAVRQSYQKQLAKLAAENNNPDKAKDEYHQALQTKDGLPTQVAEHAPNFTKGVGDKQAQISKYLWDQFPKDQSTILQVGGGKFSLYQPPKSDLIAFAEKETIAKRPMMAVEKLERGVLSTDDVDVLKKLWPNIYTQLVNATTEKMADMKHDLTIRQKNQLSVLLGKPIDESQDPQMAQLVQKNFAVQDQAKKQAAAQADKGLSKLSDDSKTASQRLVSK